MSEDGDDVDEGETVTSEGDRDEGDDEGGTGDAIEANERVEDAATETGGRAGVRNAQDAEEDEDIHRFKDCLELANFTNEQKRLIDEMQESLDTEGEEAQIRKMMVMSVSFIFQSIKGLDRFDSVMVHFGAILGINEEGTNLLLGDRCSFKFAGFIYCIRVLFLEHVLPTSMRKDMTPQDLDRFLEMRAKYLVVGSYNPTGELIKWLSYGKVMKFAEDQPAQHNVDTVERGPAGRGYLVLSRRPSAHPPIQNRGPRHGGTDSRLIPPASEMT